MQLTGQVLLIFYLLPQLVMQVQMLIFIHIIPAVTPVQI